MYTLKVVEVRKETEDTVTLCFKQPLLKKVTYKAGQYLTLIFRINGRRYIRPYSFSSAPGVDSFLEVTVKRVVGGIVSNHINDEVKIGDSIEVLPPMGDFVFEPSQNPELRHIYLWGAGSGITPLFSITKHLLANYPHLNLTLVYGNRSHESVIFHRKIQELEQSYSHQLKVWHFHTQLQVSETDNPYLIQGRINPGKVLAVMEDETDIQGATHYICGPAGLKESVKETLFKLGIKARHVFSEDFELVKNPKDFEDIKTQHVDINLNKVTTKVEVIKGKSILEAGLDASLELNYSCQTGNCTVCKGKVVSGEVKTIGPEKLPEELASNEYLLCCSYPMTENVRIEINS